MQSPGTQLAFQGPRESGAPLAIWKPEPIESSTTLRAERIAVTQERANTQARQFWQRASWTRSANITNLTDEDELMPLRYNANQSGYLRILLNDPRKIRFTMGVEF